MKVKRKGSCKQVKISKNFNLKIVKKFALNESVQVEGYIANKFTFELILTVNYFYGT